MPSPQGGLWSYSSFRERFWNPACVAAGLGEWPDDDDLPRGTRRARRHYKGLTFHDLRRASASALVAQGVDINTAQARLGHSDPRLTLALYAQATSSAADRSAADLVGAAFARTEPSTPNPNGTFVAR
jgi:integrase